MTVRANPKLIDELEIYGAQDVSKCYHCGNCSAACPFSKEPYIFPRKSMRYLQMGLEEKLKGELEPWLCYYCGECSDECPRDADPGETMMSLRRWLTARYDFTGIARLFYRSWKIELGAILTLALATAVGLLSVGFAVGSINHYDGPHAFLPSSGVDIFDWGMAALLLVLLLTNCARMWWFTIGRDKSVRPSLWSYVRKAYEVPLHFMTQKRYAKCSRKRPWAVHLTLMLSYVTMLVLIMFFLHRHGIRTRDRLACARLRLAGYGRSTGHRGMGHSRPPQEDRDPVQALPRDRLDLPDPAVHDRVHRHPAVLPAPRRLRPGGQHHLRRAPHGGRAHAGPRGALRQVVAHGVPAPGDVLLGGQGRRRGSTRDRSADEPAGEPQAA